jgi:hypothetical protein
MNERSDPHLDDEELSAIFDGEAPPSPHLSSCPICQARSGELEMAARMIGGNLAAPDAAAQEAAIGAAMGAVRPARTRWRPPAWAYPAAAALLAITALVPLLLGGGGGDTSDELASKDRDTAAAPVEDGATSGGGTAAMLAAPVTIHAGDLGTINENDLRSRVLAVLDAPRREAAAPDSPVACDTEVRTMDKKVKRLVLAGQASVNRRAGVVLVYAVTDDTPARLHAYVIAQDDCASILQFASFTAPAP